jgi:hypothetical protein
LSRGRDRRRVRRDLEEVWSPARQGTRRSRFSLRVRLKPGVPENHATGFYFHAQTISVPLNIVLPILP